MSFCQNVTKATVESDQLLASCVENALEQMAAGRGPELFDRFEAALATADPFSRAMIAIGFSRVLESIRDRLAASEGDH